ncbi:cytidylyltransferase domain-containing protein [Alkalicoccus halolimnae]|uniref:Acylneuraminate cytidylyltransferase family protein n=1 Tax=Alkalicoccus halolimnae TaxID=1667239 RepID=A0A5C7FC36_9BACI|nr:acylneuraminate cytidylyltransferase family protein [Alkalicoccus halolimnae]TXF87020.1 acylneuraminate cytidylyltransferase family protein [Alkalicoccus halolimnae]
MIGTKKILAIIPARGKSKGIPRKNIKPIAGKPLIAWTIEEANKSKYIDRLVVSTEDEEIALISEKFGGEVPFFRPDYLSKDTTPGIEPVLHAVDELPGFDYVMMLQPTSPLRTVEDVDGIIEWMHQKKYDSVVSVCLSDKTPSWMFQLTNENNLESIIQEEVIVRRQESKETYALNGALYLISLKELNNYRSFFTKNTKGYVMPKKRSFDIDDLVDFEICENILEKTTQKK